ncbi:MAG: hypothetical protein KatS3mg082_0379 [Nitrospiraceae bacterium]|nr:MAG: hypothetical protein KatS3mg082_0379 [Nitrospiraceae bacterium]
MASEIGKALRVDDAIGRYIEYAKASFPKRMNLEGLRIVVDCAHGATYKTTPSVLRELGAEVIVYGNQPNGTNINQDCGAVHPQLLQEAVGRHRADIGIALDGDADRAIFVCERGTGYRWRPYHGGAGARFFDARGQLAKTHDRRDGHEQLRAGARDGQGGYHPGAHAGRRPLYSGTHVGRRPTTSAASSPGISFFSTTTRPAMGLSPRCKCCL